MGLGHFPVVPLHSITYLQLTHAGFDWTGYNGEMSKPLLTHYAKTHI